MAPTDGRIEEQTSIIVSYLLGDEPAPGHRQYEDSCLEHDGPGDDDSFDPVLIADQLKRVADKFNDDVILKAVLNDLAQAAAKEALEAEFGRGVEALCQAHMSQMAEVAPEMQLIKASVALGLYMKAQWPELKNKVHGAMTAFLNSRVSGWVAQQGGWDRVAHV